MFFLCQMMAEVPSVAVGVSPDDVVLLAAVADDDFDDVDVCPDVKDKVDDDVKIVKCSTEKCVAPSVGKCSDVSNVGAAAWAATTKRKRRSFSPITAPEVSQRKPKQQRLRTRSALSLEYRDLKYTLKVMNRYGCTPQYKPNMRELCPDFLAIDWNKGAGVYDLCKESFWMVSTDLLHDK